MAEFEETTGGRGRGDWFMVAALTVLLMYPASVGPACWLVTNRIVPARAAGIVYEPFFWLEFQAPKSFQNAVSRYATLFGAKADYVGMRDTPFLRRYHVGDLAFRWKGGRRVFDSDPWLLDDWITCRAQPDQWEGLGGPGWLCFNPENEAIVVSQSRRVHAEVVAVLKETRSLKASLAGGRDVDVLGLRHVLSGFESEPNFRPGTVCISNPIGDQLIVGHQAFADMGELIEFLRQPPRESLRAGIVWCEERREPLPGDEERLKELCQARDLDLFVRTGPRISTNAISGQPYYRRDWWVVRASDSIYLDPE